MKTAQRVIFTLLAVLIIIFIFGNSSAEGEESASLSLRVTAWLNSLLASMGIQLELSHSFVRKLAHFIEYSALGAVLTMNVSAWQKSGTKWRFLHFWPALAGGLLTASTDEFLQLFVPDRHGCIADVLLDFSGVLWASAAVSALLTIAGRRKSKPTV